MVTQNIMIEPWLLCQKNKKSGFSKTRVVAWFDSGILGYQKYQIATMASTEQSYERTKT